MPQAALLAGFTVPIEVHTNPQSLLWMFPLLLAITVIYKATKLRVLFWKRFAREVAILFVTISLFMIAVGVGLNVLVWYLTG